jgi:flagellar biosynthesis chaperone FliJ
MINKETIHKEKSDHYEELVRNLNQDLDDKNRKLCHLESNVQHLREDLASCKEDLEVIIKKINIF